MIGLLGDFDLAEEAAQEAFAVAAERWPEQGTPHNPVGWLVATARNRAIDRIGRRRTLADKTRLLDMPEATVDEFEDEVIGDERLELIFTCCHPAIAPEAQIALTLRTLGGLSTEEIARAFLVSEETMKRRLTRAKTKIRATGIPFTVPADISCRIASTRCSRSSISSTTRVTAVASTSPAKRSGWGRVGGTDAGRAGGARAAGAHVHPPRQASGQVRGQRAVLLKDQDRSLWDMQGIASGRQELDRAIALRGQGPYVLQAAIASVQTEEEIDWNEVAQLYSRLAVITGSPIVELNRAVAIAEAGSPREALEIVDRLDLDNYQYVHSTRAELLKRLGRREGARAAYERALELAASEPERRFLQRRIIEL